MSSAQSRSYHSVNIGSYNTWDDWRLIPTSRPFVAPAPKFENLVDAPGLNGVIDLSAVLTGGIPINQNRTGSWEFIVKEYVSGMTWASLYSDILNKIHGRQMRIILDDDPGYYYTGQIAVGELKSEADSTKITINYNIYSDRTALQQGGAT